MRSGVDFIGVGVGAFILNKNKEVLLQLRKEGPEKGNWAIQGGKVRFLETIEDALRREIKEELGIDISIVRLLCVANHILRQNRIHWVSPIFLAKISSGVPKNIDAEKIQEIKWFAMRNIPINSALTTRIAIDAYLPDVAFSSA